MAVNERYSTMTSVFVDPSKLQFASNRDYAICKQVMLDASRNYSFAGMFLPVEKQHHVEALYALMRIGDDRVDVSHRGFSSPLGAINDWELTYWRAFQTGDSEHPVMRAYLNTAIECGIPADTMTAYFRAMREDLIINRFPTFSHLMHYMEGSAIPVGRAMTYILGVKQPYTIEQAIVGADSLSIAMQLSNFWRDIGEDWSRIGRIYLPQEDMELCGYKEVDLSSGIVNRNFVDLIEFEMDRTEKYYRRARSSVHMLASGRWGVMSGLEIYRGILGSIRRNGYDVFTKRARSDLGRKMGLVLSAWWQTRVQFKV